MEFWSDSQIKFAGIFFACYCRWQWRIVQMVDFNPFFD